MSQMPATDRLGVGLGGTDPSLFAPVPPRVRSMADRLRVCDGIAGRVGQTVAGLSLLLLGAWLVGLGRRSEQALGLDPVLLIGIGLAGLGLWHVRRDASIGRLPLRPALVRGVGPVVGLIGLVRLLSASMAAEAGPVGAGAGPLLDPAGLWSAVRAPMAPCAAMALILIGSSLWLMTARGRLRLAPAQVLAVVAGLLALLAILAAVFELPETGGFTALMRMSVPSALAFGVLAVGLVCARADRGLMPILIGDGAGGLMMRRLLPACLLVPTLLGSLAMLGVHRGICNGSTAVALLVVSSILVFLGLLWLNAGVIDRTEAQRRRTDEALRASEAFYHSLVETLPQNIIRKDRQGRFTFANQLFCTNVERTLTELVGATDFDFYPVGLAEKYRADDQRVMAEGRSFEVIEEHVTPDHEVHRVQIIKTPIRDTDGTVMGVQCIFWDVTDRWHYEERLREQNERLQVMALSERRAHEELKRAQVRMVQTAKLAGLGEMVAGVAHEINNPLAFVANNVAVLQRDLADVHTLLSLYRRCEPALQVAEPTLLAQIQTHFEQADLEYSLANLDSLLARTRDGLRRIQRIVGDLRVFARLDEGDLVEADLNAGIESTVSIILGSAKKKRIQLKLELVPLPPIACYAARINQVVMNLVSNAIDACDEGGTVCIRTQPEGRGVLLTVEDDGCGIPPEIRDRIFDPFFTTKAVGVGTGLGLSISFGIVQDHGGSIEIESEPGRGTRFLVHLPPIVPSRSRSRSVTTPSSAAAQSRIQETAAPETLAGPTPDGSEIAP